MKITIISTDDGREHDITCPSDAPKFPAFEVFSCGARLCRLRLLQECGVTCTCGGCGKDVSVVVDGTGTVEVEHP